MVLEKEEMRKGKKVVSVRWSEAEWSDENQGSYRNTPGGWVFKDFQGPLYLVTLPSQVCCVSAELIDQLEKQ